MGSESSGSQFNKTDLRTIALYQKVVVLCVGVLILAMLGSVGLPAELRLFVTLGVLGVDLVAAIFVFLLAL
jgi:hypothetical protein